jgi:uncharacterized protein DUF4397
LSALLGAGVLCLILLTTAAVAHAAPATEVRFVHAVSGAGPATLTVAGQRRAELDSSFGQPSSYGTVAPGEARLELRLKGQSRPVATRTVRLGPGRHTVVAVAQGGKPVLRLYNDGSPEAGRARVRAIHAAAEVGRAEVKVGDRLIGNLNPGSASPYVTLEPGRYTLAVMRAGGKGGAIVSEPGVQLVAGTASSAIVVGSGGVPAKVLVVSDASEGPSAAPLTGSGPGGGPGPWLAVVAAGLAGGALGGAAYRLRRRVG